MSFCHKFNVVTVNKEVNKLGHVTNYDPPPHIKMIPCNEVNV